MKLLVEILGMTSACNLRCSYCDWKMKPIEALGAAELHAAAEHLRRLGAIVDAEFPSALFVEYSGGEPFVYPAIVDALLDTFPERWVRISTNGTLIREEALSRMAGRKVYLAMSLDGHTPEANAPRFGGSRPLFDRVQRTLDACLEAGVPVMLLCTLNIRNIDAFEAYADHLAERYAEPIRRGLLTLPAHCVSEYDKPNGRPTVAQVSRFGDYVETRGKTNPLVAPILEHYQRLAEVMRASTLKDLVEQGREAQIPREWVMGFRARGFTRSCFLHDWQVSFHFLDDALVRGGVFRGYGCGMRGVGDLGSYPVHDDAGVRRYLSTVAEQGGRAAPFRADQPPGQRCPLVADCLVDWNAIDMIFSGAIDLVRAGAWSLMFRDPRVIAGVHAAVARYQAR